MEIMLNKDERIDNIGFGVLKLIQKPQDFCYGVDAVILADFALKTCKAGSKLERAVDLGTGTGIVPLILSHKSKVGSIVGVEIQKGSFQLGKRNVAINSLENRVKLLNCDVKDLSESETEMCQLVTMNPPYMESSRGMTNPGNAKMIARHETSATLEDFVSCASRILEDRGDLAIVHRPGRLVDICCACRKYGLEPKEIQMVSPRMGEVPNIMLVHCVKHGGKDLRFLKPLCVYGEDGNYSQEIMEIYERA